MDGHFNRLAEAGFAVGAAEEAVAAGRYQAASDAVDRADTLLDALRAAWPDMSFAERRIVGAVARDVRDRRDAVERRLPARRALTTVPATTDPEQEVDPLAA
jgi:hypothetical protein